MGEVLDAQGRLEEIYAAYAEPDADFDKLAAEQATPRGDHRRVGRRLRRADGNRRRRAAPAAVGREDRERSRAARSAASRCAACCSRSPTCCCSTSRPTTSMPRASTGSSSSCEVSRHRDRGHARPLLPRQRRGVDPRARPRLRHPVEGQLQLVARAEGAAARDRVEAGGGAHQGDEAGARVGAPEPEGPAGEEQGAHRALRGARLVRAPEAQRDAGDLHPGRRAPRRRGDRVREREQGLRRPAPDRRPVVSACRRARSSASSGRTAPARRRCSA